MGGTDTCEETQLFVRLGLIDQIDIEGNWMYDTANLFVSP